MKISKWDLMKIAEKYEGEIEFEDLSDAELKEIFGTLPDDLSADEIRARYFEYYDDIKDRTLPTHKWSE